MRKVVRTIATLGKILLFAAMVGAALLMLYGELAGWGN
jgi:hypothetical protein